MAGSLVAVFGGLLAFLEGQLDLRSVNGAPQMAGDVIRYHSERTEDLEQRAEELERDAQEQKLRNRQQKLENERLKKTIRLLARISAGAGAAGGGGKTELRDELDRELALLETLDTRVTPSSQSSPDAQHDDEGWVGRTINVPAATGSEASAAMEMSPVAAHATSGTRKKKQAAGGAAANAHVDSAKDASKAVSASAADTLIGIP